MLRSLLLAVLALALFTTPASALVNNFEGGDGDQACQLATDWSCLPASPTLEFQPDAVGAADDVFDKGKEESPDDWTFKQGSTNGKTDIAGIWSTATSVNGEAFLNLAFHRVGGGDTASAFFSFELNQSDTQWENSQQATVPCRTDGDVLISYELPNTIKLYKWDGSGGPGSCPDGASGTWTGPTNPAAEREADVNDVTIPSTLPGGPATMAPYTFGEAALNLTEVVREVGLDKCAYFKGVQAHSREAPSISSDLSDFVRDLPIGLVACPDDETEGPGPHADGSRRRLPLHGHGHDPPDRQVRCGDGGRGLRGRPEPRPGHRPGRAGRLVHRRPRRLGLAHLHGDRAPGRLRRLASR